MCVSKLKEGLCREGLGGSPISIPSLCQGQAWRRQQPRGPEREAIWGHVGSSNNPPSLHKQPKDENSWELMIF